MKTFATLCLLISLVEAPWAQAQDATEPPTMGQGEAAINVRSNVKVAIAGTGGTPKARLEALTAKLSKAVPAVRECYGKLVRKRASTVGAVRVTVRLDEGNSPAQLSVEERDPVPTALRSCVTKALGGADYRGVPRPAAAMIMLSLDNSRAEGQVAVDERSEELVSQIQATATADGRMEASWATEDGNVSFVARAKGARAEAATTAAIGALRTAYAGFMDCRRKCEKGGVSPAGSAVVKVIPRGDSSTTKILKVDIEHERAPNCMSRAFRHAKFGDSPRGVPVEVTVTFAP